MGWKFHAWVRLCQGGRITIPAEVRRRLGLEVGTNVILTVEGDSFTLMSAKASRERAVKRVRRYVSPNVSLSEELMSERKRAARRE